MRGWILSGLLAAAVGATACGTPTSGQAPGLASFGSVDPSGQTMVRCEPGQQAVVHQSTVSGRTITSVDCVTGAPASLATPVGFDEAPLPSPAVVQRVSAPPLRVVGGLQTRSIGREVVVQRKPARTWQKRAMVIGGSTGVGAGIGGLIGGKKGALIGAAVGGGGASLFEATK